MEQIKSAAILCADGTVIEDRDHARCINKTSRDKFKQRPTQGFVTSTGRFVERKEAGEIAWPAGQIFNDPEGGVIYSEEIWSTGPCLWDEDTKQYTFTRQ